MTVVSPGNFSSLYQTMLHDKDKDVAFIVQMLFKYIEKTEIPNFLGAVCGCYVTRYADRPIADYVCQCMRWFVQMGRIQYVLGRLEDYCARKGRSTEFSRDKLAQYTWEEYCS